MRKRTVPPARRRYEAAHPTVTARVPAAVKAAIEQAAVVEGLSVSAWIQAQAAGHGTPVNEAYAAGQALGERGGFLAGWLVAQWQRAAHRQYDPQQIRRLLQEDPALQASTVATCERHQYGPAWARWWASQRSSR